MVKINYIIIFIVFSFILDPPDAPNLRMITATASSIHLGWEISEDNTNPVAGE